MSTHDGHLDPERLSDLQEGLLDATATQEANAHLVGCSQCQADSTALHRVRDLLAGAPDLGPMPVDVADRIDQALAAEAGAAPTESVAARNVTPLHSPPRTPWSSRLLQAAAVIVVLLIGGGLAVSALMNSQNGGGASSASGGAAEDKSNDQRTAAPQAGAVTRHLASGTSYSAASLPTAVAHLLTAAPSPATASPQPKPESQGAQGAAPPALSRLQRTTDLDACAASIAGGPVTPLLVDLAKYSGQPAAVIVLPTPGDASTVDVWVVSPDCGPTNASVLTFLRMARP